MRIWEDLIKELPEEEQREIHKKLAKKFRKRETVRVPRHKKVAISGKIMALMGDLNLSQQKNVIRYVMGNLERAHQIWKNENR